MSAANNKKGEEREEGEIASDRTLKKPAAVEAGLVVDAAPKALVTHLARVQLVAPRRDAHFWKS
eukprot:3570308-Pyramimonas_sp.AAC.1